MPILESEFSDQNATDAFVGCVTANEVNSDKLRRIKDVLQK